MEINIVNKARKWSRDETMMLLDLVEKCPELWDVTRTEYRDRQLKATALHNISQSLNVSPEEVTRKLHNLRCQLNSEMRKIRKSIEEGEYEHNVQWEYFHRMQFMANYVGYQNKKVPTLECNNSNSSSDHKLISAYEDVEDQIFPMPLPTSTDDRKRKTEGTEKDPFEREVKVLDSNIDEDQIFGNFVASALRRLQTTRNRYKLRRIIQKAILDVEEEEERILSGSYVIETNM